MLNYLKLNIPIKLELELGLPFKICKKHKSLRQKILNPKTRTIDLKIGSSQRHKSKLRN